MSRRFTIPGARQPDDADLGSDLYETWTRTLVFPWTLGDPSERKAAELSAPAPSAAGFAGWQTAWDYWVDAWQRTVLFWDVLRQRSEQYDAEKAKPVPHVLSFDAELVLDGRTLERVVSENSSHAQAARW